MFYDYFAELAAFVADALEFRFDAVETGRVRSFLKAMQEKQ